MPERHSLQVLLQPVFLAEFSSLAKRRGPERQSRLTVDLQHEEDRRRRRGFPWHHQPNRPFLGWSSRPWRNSVRSSCQSALAFSSFLTRGGFIAHFIDLAIWARRDSGRRMPTKRSRPVAGRCFHSLPHKSPPIHLLFLMRLRKEDAVLSAFIPLRSGRKRPSKPGHLAAQLIKLRDAVEDFMVRSLAMK